MAAQPKAQGIPHDLPIPAWSQRPAAAIEHNTLQDQGQHVGDNRGIERPGRPLF